MRLFWIFALFFGASSSALAAIFCVSNSSELSTALQTAAANGENDEIRLKPGDYVPPNDSGFSFSINEANTTEISGGWWDFGTIGCFNQDLDPRITSIEGNDAKQLFRVTLTVGQTDGNVNISNLSFRNGYGPDNQNIGAIHLGIPPSNVRILFDRVLFWSNSAHSGAALTALGLQRLTIRNSAFMYNTVRGWQGTVHLRLNRDDQRFFFINNTMTGNTHSGSLSVRCSGVYLDQPLEGGNPEMLIVNSILWGNTDYDLCLPFDEDTYLFNNNIQDQFRDAMVESGNLSVEPMLAPQILDITPLPGSPMINAGLQEPIPLLAGLGLPIEEAWSYSDLDFDGHIPGRVVGGQVDIGAAESTFVDRLFCDGFQLDGSCPEH